MNISSKLSSKIWNCDKTDWIGTIKIIDEIKDKHISLIKRTPEGTLETYIPTIKRFFNN